MESITQILAALNLSSWFYLILAILINSLLGLVLAFRYQILFKQINERISILHSFYALLVAAFSTYLVPFTASVMVTKPLAIKVLSKNPLKKSVFATAFENFFDLGWQILLLPFLLISIGEEKILGGLRGVMGTAVLFLILTIILFRNYEKVISELWKFKRILPKKILRKGKENELTEENAKKFIETFIRYLTEWRFLVKILAPTLILILLLPIILQLSALIFSVSLSYRIAFIIHWIPSIIGHLSGIPAGFGSRDITMIGLLTLFGFDAVLSVKITLLNRFISMAPPLFIGGPLFLYLGKVAHGELKKER